MVDIGTLPFIGRTNTFLVGERISAGIFLENGPIHVLLPNRYVTPQMIHGSSVRAFLYTDSEDRLVATTQQPLAQVGDFALLRVVDTSRIGAFLDWGLDKDLFVPASEQHAPMRPGESYMVAVYLDNHTGRVAAASRLAEFFDYDVSQLEVGERVTAVIYHVNERGFYAIVNDRYAGILYRDETFASLRCGSKVTAYVAEVREDNKLDLRLQADAPKVGRALQNDAVDTLIAALKAAGGSLPVGDKSSPEEIYNCLGLSKKSFKVAAGILYKQGQALPSDFEVRLTSSAVVKPGGQ